MIASPVWFNKEKSKKKKKEQTIQQTRNLNKVWNSVLLMCLLFFSSFFVKNPKIMIGQSSTSIMKRSNLNLCWDPARSSFTPSHYHTGTQAHTHTRALAVSGTFSHLREWHSYMQHTNSMFIMCTSTESVPLGWSHAYFLPQGKVITVTDTRLAFLTHFHGY